MRPHCWAVSASVALAGCGDRLAPEAASDPLRLTVIVHADSTAFRNTGGFALELVPADSAGRRRIDEPWTIGTHLSEPGDGAASVLGKGVEPADTAPVAAAILIDDSGSMRYSDPHRMRATAAEVFWTALLPSRPGNRVALLDFGRGDSVATAGFERTRLLADFTPDAPVLAKALDGARAVPEGGTPLYRSLLEVVAWMDSTVPPGAQRALVVLTDGSQDGAGFSDTLWRVALTAGVRIYAAGFGGGGDTTTDAGRRLEEAASRTGGVYGSARAVEDLGTVLHALAREASPERLLVRLRLTPVPPPGTRVGGTASVRGAPGQASSPWSFLAP